MISTPSRLRYRPQPAQEGWHACAAYESGFGGAKFGGKSLGLLIEAVRYKDHPQYRGLLLRRNFPRLQELMDRAWQWFPSLGGHWEGDESRWRFPSSATVAFRHCQHEQDKHNFQGHQYAFVGFDQLEEFSEAQYTFITAQNRSPTGELIPYTRSTFNPGGIGHAWVKRRFVSPKTGDWRQCSPWMPREDRGRVLPSRCFHFANIDDNPAGEAADPTYRLRLEGLPDAERRAYLYGDWDSFSGQVFAEWSEALHVIDSAPLGPNWKRWRAIDYGIARPFVCLWLAYDPEAKRAYVYRELSRPGIVPARAQASQVLELTPGDERVVLTVADPSIWIRQSSGLSIADEYAGAGLHCIAGNNDRLSGLSKVHDWLALAPDGKPRLQVFRRCRQLIANLPSLVFDPAKVEDVESDGPDDEYDALRYGLMAAPWISESLAEAPRDFEMVVTAADGPGRRDLIGDYRRWLAGQRREVEIDPPPQQDDRRIVPPPVGLIR